MIRHWGPLFAAAKGYYLLPAVGAALVALRYALTRRGAERHARPLFAALALTAAFSSLAWFNFFNFHYGGFVNPYEFFHYYLGSKYAPEIGYFDIYNAALVADEETGRLFNPPDGQISDLRTYGYQDLRGVLAESDLYRSRFSAARWQEWVKDVGYFKTRLRRARWQDVLRDKGYNATPVWTMLVGETLSNRIATDDAAGMTFLASLDVLLLIAAALVVSWAFGAWPALLMIVFLSSSYLMAHVHMKGALLRTDFVVALVIAMCLLAKKRHALAGALVAYSTLARIFPALFLFGPLVLLTAALVPVAREAARRTGGARGAALVLAHGAVAASLLCLAWLAVGTGLRELFTAVIASPAILFGVAIVPATLILTATTLTAWGTRKQILDPRHARFFGAFALTAAALTGASIAYAGGMSTWEAFARKMAIHRTNYNHWNIGVTSIVIAQFGPPAERPASAQEWLGNAYYIKDTVREKAWIVHTLQIAALIAAFFAARRFDDAHAFAFGFVATFFLTAPTYYYYIILLVPFLFFATHPDRLRGTLGILAMFLFAGLGFAFYFRWDQYFTTYYWNSVLAMIVAISMVASAFGRVAPHQLRDQPIP